MKNVGIMRMRIAMKWIASAILIAILNLNAFAATFDGERQIREKFSSLALSYSLDQLCDFSGNELKVVILSQFLEARWWLWRTRTGVGKLITKKMADKAWTMTDGGKNCSAKINQKFDAGRNNLVTFPDVARGYFGQPGESLLNPKPGQMVLFSKYQIARQGWIIARKCQPDYTAQQSKNSKQNLMRIRSQLLVKFRPDQLAKLEKNTNEMVVWGTNGPCSAKLRGFAKMAQKLFSDTSEKAMRAGYTDDGHSMEGLKNIAYEFKLLPTLYGCKEWAC